MPELVGLAWPDLLFKWRRKRLLARHSWFYLDYLDASDYVNFSVIQRGQHVIVLSCNRSLVDRVMSLGICNSYSV